MRRVDSMIEIMDTRELVSILKEKYGTCAHYKDRGRRISLRGGERRELEFTTRYYSPDRFHYQETEAGKETLNIRFRKEISQWNENRALLPSLVEDWIENIPEFLKSPVLAKIEETESLMEGKPTHIKPAMSGLYGGNYPIWILLSLLFPQSTYADWTGIADIELKENKDGDEEFYILIIPIDGTKLPFFKFPISQLNLWIDKERLLISRITTKSHLFRHTIKCTGWLSVLTLERKEAQQLRIHNQKFLAEDSEADEICVLDHINLK